MYHYNIAMLADDEDDKVTDNGLDTDKKIDDPDDAPDTEGKDKKDDKSKEKDENKPKDASDENDDDEEGSGDDGNDEGGEDGGASDPSTDTGSGDSFGADDTPPEDKPRYDNAELHVDKVADQTSQIKLRNEIEEGEMSAEDIGTGARIDALYDPHGEDVQEIGHIAAEVDAQGRALINQADSSQALFDCSENLGENPIAAESARIIARLYGHIGKTAGIKGQRIAMESFHQSKPLNNTAIAQEGLMSFFESIYDAIVKALRRLWKWLKELFGAVDDKKDKIKKAADKLRARFKGIDGRVDKLKDKKSLYQNVLDACKSYEPSAGVSSIAGLSHELSNTEEIKKEIQEKYHRLSIGELASCVKQDGQGRWSSMTMEEILSNNSIRAASALVDMYAMWATVEQATIVDLIDSIADSEKESMADIDKKLIEIESFKVAINGEGAGKNIVRDDLREGLACVTKQAPTSGFGYSVPCQIVLSPSYATDPVKIRELLGECLHEFNDTIYKPGDEQAKIEVTLVDMPDLKTLEKYFNKAMLDTVEDLQSSLGSQATKIERVVEKLIDQVDKIKKKSSDGQTIEQERVTLLNSLVKFMTNITTKTIPQLMKMIINHAQDTLTYVGKMLDIHDFAVMKVTQ